MLERKVAENTETGNKRNWKDQELAKTRNETKIGEKIEKKGLKRKEPLTTISI